MTNEPLSLMDRKVRDCPTCQQWYRSDGPRLSLAAREVAPFHQKTPVFILRAWMTAYHLSQHNATVTNLMVAVSYDTVV